MNRFASDESKESEESTYWGLDFHFQMTHSPHENTIFTLQQQL